MKKNLTQLILGLGICSSSLAQVSNIGPSTSRTPYLQPLAPGSTVTSVLTVTDAANGYSFVGLPDGIGAFDNGNGSFTLLMNHEMGNTSGTVHAHGATGAFVSKWTINKSNLTVTGGSDLIQNVNLWTGTTYTTYNASSPSTLTAFTRFCSGDLPAITAFYNPITGKGTQERIYMNGEESGNEGRALCHIVTGPEGGNTYELPYLGKASWENYVASPYPQDKTILIGMDDATPGQVYVYVGNKSTTGTEIVKAGLSGGKLYGVAVLGLLNEGAGFPAPGTVFNLIDLGNIQNITGTTLNTNSNNVGVSNFLRPEDGAWDPSNPRDFYFVTTNAFTSPTRMWRLRFNDIKNPENGGTITAVLDGTEGPKMMDNIGIDHYGHILIQEDVGGNIHNGKIWQYKIATDALTLVAQHDTTRFITGAANFLTIDEEASGVIDAQEVFGPGMWLMVDQAHHSLPSPFVEGGQLLRFYNPASANANPEINVQGNSVSIASGNTVISTGNNTSYGNVNLTSSRVKTFVVQNSGPGVLVVNGINIGGLDAGDFTLLSSPVFPYNVPVNGSLTFYINFSPALTSVRKATIYVNNNDFDEPVYSFAVEGNGVVPEVDIQGNNVPVVNGNTIVSTANNTDLGTTLINLSVEKSFEIKNTGTGTLQVSGLAILGNNSSEFTILNSPLFPMNLNPSASQVFTVQFSPVSVGTRTAYINVLSDDADESNYKFLISAKAATDVGIKSLTDSRSFVSLFPNPAKDEAVLKIATEQKEKIEITVYDLAGKKAMNTISKTAEKGITEINLNTANLANGEYLIRINTASNSNTLKLVVIH